MVWVKLGGGGGAKAVLVREQGGGDVVTRLPTTPVSPFSGGTIVHPYPTLWTGRLPLGNLKTPIQNWWTRTPVISGGGGGTTQVQTVHPQSFPRFTFPIPTVTYTQPRVTYTAAPAAQAPASTSSGNYGWLAPLFVLGFPIIGALFGYKTIRSRRRERRRYFRRLRRPSFFRRRSRRLPRIRTRKKK